MEFQKVDLTGLYRLIHSMRASILQGLIVNSYDFKKNGGNNFASVNNNLRNIVESGFVFDYYKILADNSVVTINTNTLISFCLTREGLPISETIDDLSEIDVCAENDRILINNESINAKYGIIINRIIARTGICGF